MNGNEEFKDRFCQFYNQRVPKCVPNMHIWRSDGARLVLGQYHKYFIYKYKRFYHNYLQTSV